MDIHALLADAWRTFRLSSGEKTLTNLEKTLEVTVPPSTLGIQEYDALLDLAHAKWLTVYGYVNGQFTLADRIRIYLARAEYRHAPVRVKTLANYLSLPRHSRESRQDAIRWLQEHRPTLHADLIAMCPTLHSGAYATVFYTTAPVDYDGFGTETLAVVGTCDREPLRKVRIQDQYVSWQVNRYGSGLHPAFTEEQFQVLQTCRWFTKE